MDTAEGFFYKYLNMPWFPIIKLVLLLVSFDILYYNIKTKKTQIFFP